LQEAAHEQQQQGPSPVTPDAAGSRFAVSFLILALLDCKLLLKFTRLIAQMLPNPSSLRKITHLLESHWLVHVCLPLTVLYHGKRVVIALTYSFSADQTASDTVLGVAPSFVTSVSPPASVAPGTVPSGFLLSLLSLIQRLTHCVLDMIINIR